LEATDAGKLVLAAAITQCRKLFADGLEIQVQVQVQVVVRTVMSV
jgi:hypothetical protein